MKKLLSNIISRVTAFFASDARDVDARFANLAGQVDVRLDAVEKDCEKEAAALHVPIDALTAQVNQLEADLRGVLATLSVDATALSGRVGTLERELESQRDVISHLDMGENGYLHARVNELEAERVRHHEAILHLDMVKRAAINYGGANPPVKVCARWNPAKGGSFQNFLEDLGVRPDGATLGRLGDVGDYKPSNCRWESHSESERQRRIKRAKKAVGIWGYNTSHAIGLREPERRAV